MLTIKNATIITPFKTLINATLVIEKKYITFVGKKKTPKTTISENKIINAKGLYVCPGFIDVHTQGIGNYDVWDNSINSLINMSKLYAKHGVTGFLATTDYKQDTIEFLNKNIELPGAKMLGIHIEGPFISKDFKGAIPVQTIKKPDYKILNNILTYKKIKMITVAPELNGINKIIKILNKRKIIVSLGHTNSNYEQALESIKNGATHCTHIFNAMRPFDKRDIGVTGACLSSDNVSVQVIPDGIHLHPSVLKFIYRIKPLDKIVIITDSIRAASMPDGVYKGNFVKYRGKVYLKNTNTLAGSCLTMENAVKNMFKFSGANLNEVISMATINPAKVIGIDNKLGSLQTGKIADITIIDKNFNVKMTIVNGRIVKNILN